MPKRMPEFSPYEAPVLICPSCGNDMRMVVAKHANGKVQGITYFCDTCEYGFASSVVHHNGQMTKYEPPAPAKALESGSVAPAPQGKPGLPGALPPGGVTR
jgi:predicted RNA-binding Zn-ribbon protein involved in translation (DUF1610 family)